MSLEQTKKKCVACGAYLFEEDDVVFCPECGAPHHRDCYNAIGHCAMEDKHGTPEEYGNIESHKMSDIASAGLDEESKITTVCGMCGEKYDSTERACPHCAAPNTERFGIFKSFDFLGGVPGDVDLGEGVKADEAKQFVLNNTQRYIPKFAANKIGKKTSWNWLAFLFPCGWFLSRKMYKYGAFVGAIQVAITLLMAPLASAISYIDAGQAESYADLAKQLLDNIPQIGMSVVVTAAIASVLTLVFHIICGIFGDYIYRNFAIEKIKNIKQNSDDMEYDFRRCGGVNLFAFLAGFLITDYLPSIIASFLGL